MRRLTIAAPSRLLDPGLAMPVPSGRTSWWDDFVYYELSPQEIATLKSASEEIHRCCLDAVGHIVENQLYGRMGVSGKIIDAIDESWCSSNSGADDTLYGRMDLMYDGSAPPQLLEYNAESPTSALETDLGQRAWLAGHGIGDEPFADIRSAMAARWQALQIRQHAPGPVIFAYDPSNPIDAAAGAFMENAARAGGLDTVALDLADLAAWTAQEDAPGRRALFKLVRWDRLVADGIVDPVALWARCHVVEPPWKMLVTSKLLLPLLYELFPAHPNFLPTSRDRQQLPPGLVVRKPACGMAQMNIAVLDGMDTVAESGGDFGDQDMIYQAYATPAECDGGFHPSFGCWVVGAEAVGVGIVEFEGVFGEHRWRPHVVR